MLGYKSLVMLIMIDGYSHTMIWKSLFFMYGLCIFDADQY